MSARLRGHAVELALYLGAALCFWLAAGPASSAADDDFGARDPAGLRVVTWNVGGSAGEAGRPLADEHLEAVAETLRSLDPDLAVLQEVASEAQLDRLTERLGEEHWQARLVAGGDRCLAVLAKRGALATERIGVGRRGRAAYVRYHDRKKPPVTLLALHASAYSALHRNLSIGRALDALAGRTTENLLLVGDLNLDVDPSEGRDVFSDNAYRDVETYNVLSARLVDAGLGAGNTAEPDRRLDYVWYAEQAYGKRACRPWKGRRVGDMDHDPLVADLMFRR